MKVLVTGFEWFGDLVPFIVRALGELGHTSEVSFTNRDVLIRRRQAALSWLGRVTVTSGPIAARWRAGLAREGGRIVNEEFRRHVDRFRPDAILSVLCWGEPLRADALAAARGAKRIGWLMDDPFGYEGSCLERLLSSFDRLYSVDDGWSENVERMTGIRPKWMPCGADPHTHAPVEMAARDRELAGHVVYVGSSCVGHPTGVYRRVLLESLGGLPLAIFGDRGWLQAGDALVGCYRGGPVSSDEANRIYASAAVVLNFHHPQFRRGTSLRTFALCCSGAFQVADWRDGLDCWLRPGVELETFRTPGELRAIVERYLADEPARSAIARAGRARVLHEHTYRHRLAAMLQS